MTMDIDTAVETVTGTDAVVRATGLHKTFQVAEGFFGKKKEFQAVKNVDLAVPKGSTLGIIGESGSGKTTVARMLVGLLSPTSGDISINGQSVFDRRGRTTTAGRTAAQMVFQDPYSALNPRMNVRAILSEPMTVAPRAGRREIARRVDELIDQVGLSSAALDKYPHEFSGGQRQRLVIARAMARKPPVLVCDEPVSALDVSIQSQILNLLKELQEELGLTYVFIGHGLESVYFMSDRISVMFKGEVVEQGTADDILHRPQHEYTKQLIESSRAQPFKSR
ncbi:ATP-binding cassette domain-containing protein [Microbacterium sp. ASV81]|uniref:ATP-binding cassette domain-containing protein n=1 Tax=Microbacterium capsulatum TaxID=3041921 RepID=A0ABU0XIK9_9MICO|nr:ATP-binding cassette domain-containing protein [Microbacterium sp. ASV81]MDQ4214976.1 ATP-binding cassette domain-containing protein [Microbacterium sp. ASV81]